MRREALATPTGDALALDHHGASPWASTIEPDTRAETIGEPGDVRDDADLATRRLKGFEARYGDFQCLRVERAEAFVDEQRLDVRTLTADGRETEGQGKRNEE